MSLSEDIAIILLLLLNVFQFWFWSKQVQSLIDKLMSKNYAEYVQAKGLASSAPSPTRNFHEFDTSDPVLEELNRSIGVV